MFVRRLTTSLKEQRWMTILIELFIVIVGVFVGTWVADWNQRRVEKDETERMLVQLVPELDNQLTFFAYAKSYYATARHYALDALAGWRGDPRISDEQFVIAAYQASQIYGIGINAQNWSLTFGGDQLRQIDDPRLRRNLSLVLTADYDPVAFNAVATPYRENVRRVIPNDVQDRIRAECGDHLDESNRFANLYVLPPTCALKLGPAEAAATAAALRANRDLRDQLNWHLAAVATYLENAKTLELPMLTLKKELTKGSHVAVGPAVR